MSGKVPSFPAVFVSNSRKAVTPERLGKYKLNRKSENLNNSDIASESSRIMLIPASKSGFLTHTKSRMYPLTIGNAKPRTQSEETGSDLCTPVSETDLESKRGIGFTRSNPRLRKNRLTPVPVSLDSPSKVASPIPKVSYREYRYQHMKRHNNTTPGQRQYADHSIGSDSYNDKKASKRFYKPQVIRLTARSKIVLHSSFPLQFPENGLNKAKKKTQPEKMPQSLKPVPIPVTVASEQPSFVLSNESDEPLAITFGDKLLKVQRVMDTSLRLL